MVKAKVIGNHIHALDQLGGRKEYYPIAFALPRSHVGSVTKAMERDGWNPIKHYDASHAFQDKKDLFGLGLFGRQHIVIFEVGQKAYVTAHVDTPVPHRKDAPETLKLLKSIRDRYGTERRNPAEPVILLDLHSYPEDSEDYGKYDMCLLRVQGVTDDRFLTTVKGRLKGWSIGIFDIPKARADIITETGRKNPGAQVLLLEVNEMHAKRLQEIARCVSNAIAQGRAEESRRYSNPPNLSFMDNPSPEEMYKIFHDFDPDQNMRLNLPTPQPPVLTVSDVDAVVYWCSKWSKKNPKNKNIRYIHRWERNKLIYAEDVSGYPWLIGRCCVRREGITDWTGARTWKDRAELVMPHAMTLVYLGILEELQLKEGHILRPFRSILCCDARGERLYIVPLPAGTRPTHPEVFR